ncbi:Hypothetical predicted protein, partial [Paramuricea clavata]
MKGKWKVPRGGCKEFKNDINVRWYENERLLLEGPTMKGYKGILQKIATIKPNSEYSLGVNNLADFSPPQKPSIKNFN